MTNNQSYLLATEDLDPRQLDVSSWQWWDSPGEYGALCRVAELREALRSIFARREWDSVDELDRIYEIAARVLGITYD